MSGAFGHLCLRSLISFSTKYFGTSALRSSEAVARVKQVNRSVPEFWRALQPVRRQISSLYA